MLDRVTDAEGEIARLTHAEVRAARVGGREEVPTLAELFEEFPDTRFNIDLKSVAAVPRSPASSRPVAAHDRVLVGSFSSTRMREFRRLTAGRVATSATPPEVAAFLAAPRRAAAAGCRRRLRRLADAPAAAAAVRVTTPGLLRRAHAAGKHVHVWTVDDPAEMAELLELGVDGLFTDRTDVLERPGSPRTVAGEQH